MIHQFKNNGFAFVVDTASGAVHSVDDVAYDVIAMYGDHDEDGIVRQITEKYGIDEDEVKECLADVRELIDRGLLFSEDEFRDLPPKNGKSTVKALCLHVAHTCNLNCEYCFASQGKYNKSASRGKPALMSFEVGRQAIDFLIENSPGRRNLEVDFFGGEPLMNWEVVKEIVAYARSVEKEAGKNFRFTLTTNGVLLDDEVTDFLNREMHNVVLSLDGRREVHDRFRKTYAGEGSYDTVVPKFQRFVGRRGGRGYYVRGTFTHLNTDFLEDIKHMASLGFRELSMEPVVCAPGDPYALTEEDLPVLFEQYDAGGGDAPPGAGGRSHHLLPLHAGSRRRAVHLQEDRRMRLRIRVHGGDSLGRAVPLSPVRERPVLLSRQRVGRRDESRAVGEVPRVQRVLPPGVRKLLG